VDAGVVKFSAKWDIDTRRLERCVKGDEVLIGYPSGIAHPNAQVENAKIAEWLHEGTARIPSRPFLYQGILSRRSEIRQAIGRSFKNLVLRGKSEAVKVAVLAVGAVQEFVRGDYYKAHIPNAPATIRAKSKRRGRKTLVGDKPLIDTGFMINSTTYVIKDLPVRVPRSRIRGKV
jgi:hypothetical protein